MGFLHKKDFTIWNLYLHDASPLAFYKLENEMSFMDKLCFATELKREDSLSL